MSLKRDYWKWRIGAGRRGTLRRASMRTGNGFEIMGACAAMLDHARRESHWIDNPEGAFTTSIEDLAIDYSTPPDRVREALGALVATGWLSVSPDPATVGADESVSVRVNKYLDFNYPQGSDADRKAAQRLREADEARDAALGKTRQEQEVVTGCHELSVKSLEERREEEKRNTSTKAAPSLDIPRMLFDHWLTATSRNANQNRLTTGRRAHVNGRLRDGYTVEQLQQAIDGIAGSAWHKGANPNGKRYDTFDFIMRSGENVEKGMEAATPVPAAAGDDRSAALLAYYQNGGAA